MTTGRSGFNTVVVKQCPFIQSEREWQVSPTCVLCVPMPTHCTITCFGFHARWIDGVKCGLFSNHATLGQTTLRVGWVLYSVREKVEVRVTVSVTVCVVLLCCVGWWWWWWWKEGRRWNLVPAHSLLFSKSTKGDARLNVPIRRTNRYQEYYMPSQHTYCGRVWNLIQDCDIQSSN